MKGSTIGLIVVSALVLCIGGIIAFVFGSSEGGYGVGTPRGSARSASTLSNVKQLGIALAMYATDYDDRLPVQMTDFRNLRTVIDPYVRNTSIYRTLNPNGGRLESNEDLAAAPYEEIEDPDNTVMLFESNDWPDGRRVVGYADSHARYVSGFDKDKETEVVFTTAGQRIMDEMAKQLEAQAAAASGQPSTGALGMPGG